MKTKVVLFLILTFFVTSLHANNVQLAGTVNIVSATGGTVTMEVDLSWDNSWCDDYNWDAVWLFFKYKQGVDGAWQHAAINASTATVMGGDYAAMSATTASTVPGLFVYPSKDRGGNTGTLKVQVQWASNYTKTQFDNNDVFVVAHAIEMVYIPYGAYTIGDGSSANALLKTVIDSEAAWNGTNANFPKGYQGFYVMKYETSQEQYVEFLNTLTLAQQKALIPNIDKLSVGNFVFGTNKTAPNYRNGVILSAKQTGKPLMFDNNLNNNKQYSEDGDGGTLAMNYMSISDAQGYASWAGLRPLTEMEYEKACRRPFPQEPDAGEYAWNSSMGAVNASGLMLVGTGSETVATGNVNAGNGLGGPVRCGIFASPNTATQTAAGATYWGVMEMSGNVSELCANITHTTIFKTRNGMGTYNATLFGSTPSTYGTRGGGFSGTHTTLATSDRSAVSRFTDLLQRDSSVGFRCAYTYGAASTVDAGTIAEDTKPCPGTTVTFSGTPASTGDVKIMGYIWSVNDGSGYVVIPGESAPTLAYSNFAVGKTYTFKRKAVCPLGEKEVSSISYTIPNTTVTLSPTSAMIDDCGGASKITATCSGATFVWSYSGTTLSSTNTYTPSRADFNFNSGSFEVICTSKVSDCQGVAELQVDVPNITIVKLTDVTLANCGLVSFRDPRDEKVYCTRKIGDLCWMGINLQFGTCNASTFNSYWQGSTQNQIAPGYYGVCIPSTQPGAGNLYNWQAAMNDPNAVYATSGNPSGNVNGNSPNQWQGICPDGWHLPSGGSTGEFQTMYTALGSVPAKIYPGLGVDEFRSVLGGYGSGESVIGAGSNAYYWSSTYTTTYLAYRLYFYNGSVNPQFSMHKYHGCAVRCVKNY